MSRQEVYVWNRGWVQDRHHDRSFDTSSAASQLKCLVRFWGGEASGKDVDTRGWEEGLRQGTTAEITLPIVVLKTLTVSAFAIVGF